MWKNINRWALLSLLALSGCVTTTAPPMPKVDVSAPGWTVRQGQAVWHPPHRSQEIAGDLIVATGPDGAAFIQFSKTPFTLATAQKDSKGWQLEIPPQNRRYARHGKAPAQIVWFQLSNALAGMPVAKRWTWSGSAAKFRLENPSSGESLDGFLTQ